MELFDSHVHLDVAAFDADRLEALARARASGVSEMLVPAIERSAWPALLSLADAEVGVYAAVGVHPQALPDLDAHELQASLDVLDAASRHARVVAIGECGLDGAVQKDGRFSLERQSAVLHAHLDVALARELPVVLHVLGAHDVALRVLEARGPLRHGGVMHSYSGSAELVPRYVALNLSISFAGAVTRPNARRPLDAARAVPRDRLLVETDAPDQTPHAAPTLRNEPAYLARIAAALADARGERLDDLAAQTTENARRLFRITARRALRLPSQRC